MTILQSILLGLLQGVAEFLPISSSGHLALAQKLFNLDDVPLLYDVFLHLATLLAVCIFFRKTIIALFKVLWRWITKSPLDATQGDSTVMSSTVETSFQSISPTLCGTDEIGRKTILMIIATTFVTGALGVVTSKLIPDLPIQFTLAGFLITAAVLILSAKIPVMSSEVETSFPNPDEPTEPLPLKLWQALTIGAAQGIGTLPGISRSGSTIAGALFCGIDRRTAGDYSFIVSIPAILGAFVLELKDLGEVANNIGVLQVVLGCVSAFIAGYFSLAFLMKLVRKGKLQYFAAYLIPLAILGFVFF